MPRRGIWLALILAVLSSACSTIVESAEIRRNVQPALVKARHPRPQLTAKEACTVGISGISCRLMLHSIARAVSGQSAEVSTASLNYAGQMVGTVHAAVVSTLGLAVVLQHKTQPPCEDDKPHWLGTISLCISLGYFLYDLPVLFESQYSPLAPMVAHHAFSCVMLLLALSTFPSATYYACFVQVTEAVVPFTTAVFVLEKLKEQGTWLYCAARWTQLIVWLVVRQLLFIAFAWEVRRDWPLLTVFLRRMSITTGVLLGLFNTVGLGIVVLPGMPWLPGAVAEAGARG